MGSHLLTAIGQDPILRHVKLIAEPWDASMDGYQVGEFPPPWSSGTTSSATPCATSGAADGAIRDVATRLAGSSDLYADDGRSPYASINFVTAHDGFTLRDLVSYNDKHNEANGEDNRDGTDNNRSWNCGVEGETDDPDVLALRHRQAANLMATLCLSNGVPMLTAGDERGGRSAATTTPSCQDNEISWIDWRPDDAWLDIYEMTRAALRLRREHPVLRQRHWFEGGRRSRAASRTWSGCTRLAARCERATGTTTGSAPSGCSSTAPAALPGPRGEQQHDSSFMIWLNSGIDDID